MSDALSWKVVERESRVIDLTGCERTEIVEYDNGCEWAAVNLYTCPDGKVYISSTGNIFQLFFVVEVDPKERVIKVRGAQQQRGGCYGRR